MLPNGYYDDLRRIEPGELEFVCYGIPRSGSTLVYQLIAGICPAGVAKTHSYCDHPVKTLVSYRDFRDITVSGWRGFDPAHLQRRMTEGEIRTCADLCRANVRVLDRYFRRSDVCRLKYEEFAGKPELIFSAIESAFGIVVPVARIAELVRRHSLAENKRISERLEHFSQCDPKNQIHGNHIYRGEVGSWRDFVDERGAELLESLLRPCLAQYGYLA